MKTNDDLEEIYSERARYLLNIDDMLELTFDANRNRISNF